MKCIVITALALLSTAPAAQSQPADAQALVRRAVAAMGGEQALRGLATLAVEFNTSSFGLGQEETSRSPARGPIAWGRIFTDWRGNRRAQVQEVRQLTGVVLRQRQVIAGDLGLNEANGVPSAMAPGAVAGALQGMRTQPDRLLLRALDTPAAVTPIAPKTWRGELMPGARFAQGADTVLLYFDRLSGLLTVSDFVSDDPILGDRHATTMYTRWQDAGGLKLPRQFDSETNGRLLSQNLVTSLTISPLSDTLFAIPDSIARVAQRAAPVVPAVNVSLVELAPFVWRAEGGTHHSLIVDQGNYLVVVEAPQSRLRTQAVLDTLKARFPGKPVGLVVNTHHHWDHSGGVRTALANGIRVVTHRRNVAFVREVGMARKTVRPDQLSRGRPLPVITAVADSLVLGSGERRVVLYEVPTAHVEGLLAAYVPSARVLFTADVVSPPVPPATTPLPALGSGELLALVRARGIAVDRYAAAHGAVVSWADIERAASPR